MKKVHQLNNIVNNFEIDIMGGSETQADWRFVKEEHQFWNLFGKGKDDRSVAANNTAKPKMRQDQQGGTGMVAFVRITSFVRESLKDLSNLERFYSMLLTSLPFLKKFQNWCSSLTNCQSACVSLSPITSIPKLLTILFN